MEPSKSSIRLPTFVRTITATQSLTHLVYFGDDALGHLLEALLHLLQQALDEDVQLLLGDFFMFLLHVCVLGFVI